MVGLEAGQHRQDVEALPVVVAGEPHQLIEKGARAAHPADHGLRRRGLGDVAPEPGEDLAERTDGGEVGGGDLVGAADAEVTLVSGADGEADQQPVEAPQPGVLREAGQLEGRPVRLVEPPVDAGGRDELHQQLPVV